MNDHVSSKLVKNGRTENEQKLRTVSTMTLMMGTNTGSAEAGSDLSSGV